MLGRNKFFFSKLKTSQDHEKLEPKGELYQLSGYKESSVPTDTPTPHTHTHTNRQTQKLLLLHKD